MRLSTRARYALRMMLQVARASAKGKSVSMSAIARETDISKSYLEQLAIPLKAAGLLHGRTGRAGGYVLLRPASEIRIREIVEATIGQVDLVECVGDPKQCTRSHDCETRLIWVLFASRLRGMLEEYSLADLANPEHVESIRKAVDANLVQPQSGQEKKQSGSTCRF